MYSRVQHYTDKNTVKQQNGLKGWNNSSHANLLTVSWRLVYSPTVSVLCFGFILDEVIRKRLLIDGDGAGDDRRINVLLKSFTKWCNTPGSPEEG